MNGSLLNGRFKANQKRRDAEKGTRACEKKHREMIQRLSATATIPASSSHLQSMQAPAFDQRVVDSVLGRDSGVFEIFQMVKEFAQLPDNAPDQKPPPHASCLRLGFGRVSVRVFVETYLPAIVTLAGPKPSLLHVAAARCAALEHFSRSHEKPREVSTTSPFETAGFQLG